MRKRERKRDLIKGSEWENDTELISRDRNRVIEKER